MKDLTTKLNFIGEGIQQKLDNLHQFSQHLYTKAAQQKILRALAFDGMRDRIETVAVAHDTTFRWIFDGSSSDTMAGVISGSDSKHSDDSDGGSDRAESASTTSDESSNEGTGMFEEAARAKVNSFVEWLSSGTGVYHIAGKLGSGKSTLMKYLAEHGRVREELQRWAGAFRFFLWSFACRKRI